MKKWKILLIDDEPGFTEMVKLNLDATDRFEVKIENNATHAVEAALLYRPDLILLDIIMPGLEGPDILCQIKKFDELSDIPVIFLTATIRKNEFHQGDKIGGHIFLAKPTTLDELIDCIHQHLGPAEE